MSRTRHQLVIGGVEFDLVAPIAAGIEGAKLWDVLVASASSRRHFRRAPMPAEIGELLLRRSAAKSRDRLDQGSVDGIEVDIFKRRRLVEDLVGGKGGSGHGRSP